MEQALQIILSVLFIIVFALLAHKIISRITDSSKSSSKSSPECFAEAPLPPGPRRFPIIGHLHLLLAGNSLPHITLRNLSSSYGPVMLLRLGQFNYAVVSSREAAEEVLRTNDLSFASRPEITRSRYMTYGYSEIAMAPYGPGWRLLRKICITELLTVKRVASFASVRKEAASTLVKDIASAAAASPGGKVAVNLSVKLQEAMNDIISKSAFGLECRPGMREEFLRIMKDMLLLTSGFSVADLFPSLEFVDTLLGVKSRIEKHVRRMDAILDEIIAEHKARLRFKVETIAGGGEEMPAETGDLLDVLIRARDEGRQGQSISSENVKAVAVELFFAGTDTASSTINWAMSELIRNPEAMGKAQREVRRAAMGKVQIEEEDLNGLHYLKQVIKETLRLHPPLPTLIPRLCRETCRVQGYTVLAGTRVLINVWALGKDARYWEEPEVFSPERFDGKLVDFRGTDFEFLPFGAGRRMCPGMNFGLANVELPLAHLLLYFDWELPGGMRPGDLDMTESRGSTARKKVDLLLLATPCVLG